ncbi:MAG: tryptophanase [Vulcanimicrobiota bacterium]
MARSIIEPFRIKMTEPIGLTSQQQRQQALQDAHLNVFLLAAEHVTVDLLTDSGTGAMSAAQWGAMMMGDESYAGARSWHRFQATLQEITGLKHIFPTHQGRAAERILATALLRQGHIVPNNSHFDTTRANVEFAGAVAADLPTAAAAETSVAHPFKGNMDIGRLEQLIAEHGAENIPFCMITVTNNSGGGQPVSLENIRQTKEVCRRHSIPLVLDACRFAENAYFIKQREAGQAERSLSEIAGEMFSYADAATMSAKKDGLVNIGGFLACNCDDWAEKFRNLLILTEGFPTYGGLAGRDLEAIAVGLKEALEIEYQHYRHATVKYMADRLTSKGIPIVLPPGGHAVFLDAARFCEHLQPLQYPGIGLVNALYLQGGVRGVELGSVMFGRIDESGRESPARLELVRLAFPRRVYTQSHFDYTIEVLEEIHQNRQAIPAHRIVKQPPFLRHFTAWFEVA